MVGTDSDALGPKTWVRIPATLIEEVGEEVPMTTHVLPRQLVRSILVS